MEFNYVRLNQYIFSTDLDFQIWMDQTRRFYTEADTVNPAYVTTLTACKTNLLAVIKDLTDEDTKAIYQRYVAVLTAEITKYSA